MLVKHKQLSIQEHLFDVFHIFLTETLRHFFQAIVYFSQDLPVVSTLMKFRITLYKIESQTHIRSIISSWSTSGNKCSGSPCQKCKRKFWIWKLKKKDMPLLTDWCPGHGTETKGNLHVWVWTSMEINWF